MSTDKKDPPDVAASASNPPETAQVDSPPLVRKETLKEFADRMVKLLVDSINRQA